MKVTIIGGGYVGHVSAACFSELGHNVHLIEIDQKKVDTIHRGIPPIYEPCLEELLRKHIHRNFIVSSDYGGITESECTFICVGTPPAPDGSADLRYIRSAAQSIGASLKDGRTSHTVHAI